MSNNLRKEGKFSYIEAGEGQPIIVLHGLMGALSNFEGVFNYFSKNGYKVLIPELPIYSLPLLKTNVKNLSKFLKEFMEYKNIEKAVLKKELNADFTFLRNLVKQQRFCTRVTI